MFSCFSCLHLWVLMFLHLTLGSNLLDLPLLTCIWQAFFGYNGCISLDPLLSSWLSHNFKLTRKLYQIRQEPSKRIIVYHNWLKSIWDQLIASEPVLSNSVDTKLVYVHREQG